MTAPDSRAVERWLGSATFDAAAGGRLAPGNMVGGWRVAAFLGAGLSAEVYRVRNVRFGHEGALKLLTDGSRGLKERFLAEVSALKTLSLDALPRYLDAGTWEGAPYYVMEYLQPLEEPMPRREVAGFVVKVAKAVQTLHEAGYIHRDLKPGNILRRKNGEPVLIDLGLVKRRGTGVTDPVVRHGHGISIIDGKPVGVGTLDYAAPEQLLRGEASVRSDVFALGKMLRAFYEGLPPRNLKGVVRKATSEHPGDRYASAADFAAAIRRRNRPLNLLLAAAVALAVAVALHPVWMRQSGGAPADETPETPEARLTRLLPRAEDGETAAQMIVAEAYFHGHGTATNRVEAVKWYRKAASAGDASAQASLGLCLLRGWGVEKDAVAAVKWYRRAAAQTNLVAMSDLAFCHIHGFGVDRDPAAGFKIALEAAERGHGPAQAMVGECYQRGIGVERDEAKAEQWLYKASRSGNRRAPRLLE